MFEKGPKTRANLWVLHSRVSSLIAEPGLEFQSAPSAGLFATKGEDQKAKYRRHSALKTMRS
jgi:hypothetical protein